MLVKLYVEYNQVKIKRKNLASYKVKAVVSKIGYVRAGVRSSSKVIV